MGIQLPAEEADKVFQPINYLERVAPMAKSEASTGKQNGSE